MRRFLFGFLAVTIGLAAQSRISDKDVESLMKNLQDDAKSFRPVFQNGLKKSAIRKTSREKDAKQLAERFEKQTKSMHDRFKKTTKADSELQAVRDTAQQIDGLVTSLNLDSQTSSRWQKIQSELGEVLGAFNMQPLHASATSPGDLNGPPCSQAMGSENADRLVEQCRAVSPATHPPCNARNSCALIIDEIKRGCALLAGRNPPSFCSQYR
ncbi:MAG TPA: hypothetical protein VH477_02860 [Bryobacteraceae bacterium]|jgi:hypothetical protein